MASGSAVVAAGQQDKINQAKYRRCNDGSGDCT